MAFFPTSVATDAQLYIAVNGIQTALALPALITDTVLTLVSTTAFPSTGAVTVDNNEIVFYTGVSGNTLTGCTRGADGSTPLPHSAGAIVGLTIVAAHHNLLKNEIEAIETALGAGYTRTLENLSDVLVTSPTTGQILQWNGTDWININYAAGITQLIGDVTAGPGSGSQTATLANTAVTPGSYTNVNLTVDAKGRVTSISNGASSIPTGSIIEYGGSSAPVGFVMADGASYTTAALPGLFAVFGYTYGGGGANFNVPNKTNRAGIGQGGSIAPTLGSTAGSTTHTLVDAEMAATAVTVNITDPTHNHNLLGNSVNSNDNSITLAGTGSVSVDAGSTHPGTAQYRSVSVANALPWIQASATGITASGNVNGSATPFSIVQPVIGLNYIIKT